MTLTVFTTVLGGQTDPLRLPRVVNPRVRYVCFTDQPLRHGGPYQLVRIAVGQEGPCLASRRLKILADHPALGRPDVVLWHDAAFELRVDPVPLVARYLGRTDLAAFRHPHRSQIADEAVAIATLGYAPADVLSRQVAAYQAEGFTQTAITSTGFSLRRLTPAIRAFQTRWWREVERWTWRDQMSVDYALWREQLPVTYLAGHYRDNPYAQFYLAGQRAPRLRGRTITPRYHAASEVRTQPSPGPAPSPPASGPRRLSVITPTADRPQAFALAERWMARQTQPPDEWIVADGGQTPVVCTQGQRHLHVPQPPGPRNFTANLARGIAVATGDVIVFWEDDDWYAPTHLAHLLRQLTPGILAAGDDQQRYYHLAHRVWRVFQNRGASLCQTALTRAALPLVQASVEACHRAGTYGVDGGFWDRVPVAARALQHTDSVVGLKGLPGQEGLGIGHRPLTQGSWHSDPARTQLRHWIGDDVAVYTALMAPIAPPTPLSGAHALAKTA